MTCYVAARIYVTIFVLQNLETALAGGLGQISPVKYLPDVSTQSRVFSSGNEMVGRSGWEAKSVGGHVGHGWCSE